MPYPKLIVAFARLSEADFQVRVNAIIAALPNHARVPEPWPAPVPGLTQVRHVAVDKLPPSPTWVRLRAARPGGMSGPCISPISVIVARSRAWRRCGRRSSWRGGDCRRACGGLLLFFPGLEATCH